MQAAVLKSFGEPLVIMEVESPTLGTGEVLVDVAAATVLPYAAEVFSGKRKYLLPTPVIPGCGAVGRVRQTGPDATHLKEGDWVFCDPTVRSRDNPLSPDIVLQGWSARGEGGQLLQQYFKDGPFAQQIRVPTENAIPLGDLKADEAGCWCALTVLLIAYGGLRAMRFQPGQTLLVSGSTGNFGSATVQIALAMGARAVIAPGRNQAVLDDLVSRFGKRVFPIALSGDQEMDTARLRSAAGAAPDAVLDFLPPEAPTSAVRTAILAVQRNGTVVLMGGVGMLGGEDLSLPYPWIMRNNINLRGQWMYPQDAGQGLINLIRSGLLDLGQFAVAEFALNEANAAIQHAAGHPGPFQITVLRPQL